MVLRVFESDVNHDALVEPILSAMSWVASPEFAKHGLALLDAIDQIKLTGLLATMHGLDVFSEQSIGSYLATAIRNKAMKILEPVKAKDGMSDLGASVSGAPKPSHSVKQTRTPRPLKKPAPRMAA
jgi:hypothetical protein